MATRGVYISDWFENGNNNLSLSGSGGLRGYDKNFKTGERMALVNIEGRFFTGLEILSAMFGGVVFTDFGRTWKDDEKFELRDFYLSVGLGLRLHIERTSKGRVLRFDISYSEKNGWQISTGTGQLFFLNKILSY